MESFFSLFSTEKETDVDAHYRRRILAEYKERRPSYEEFAVVIHRLLDAMLKEAGYKYQTTYRTKAPERLREKLIRKGAAGTKYSRLGDVEDLAGIRVLFYSETDTKRFLNDLKKEVGESLTVEERREKSGYEATHVVLSLGPKRLQLSEYRHLAGLKCEVQITSVLRHAWAEIEHDFIYKDIAGISTKDPERFARMKKQLEDILEKYIKKASVEFEKVMQEVAD